MTPSVAALTLRRSLDYIDSNSKDYCKISEAIETLLISGKWIDPRKSLPENKQRVLVVYQRSLVTIARYSKFLKWHEWEICGKLVDPKSISYWQPLPEVPKLP